MLQKLIRPAPDVRSRLHDRAGLMASAHVILMNMPRAVLSRVIFSVFAISPARPWISYNAAAMMARKMLDTPCAVLEFGSGSSTAWFARRARELHSVENDREWFDRVKVQVDSRKAAHTKIEYEFQPERDGYVSFRKDHHRRFNIILVDGPWRQDCIERHIHLLADDGIFYVDNTDADSPTNEPGEIGRAVARSRDLARRLGLHEVVFTDFAPCTLHATQGLMFAKREIFQKYKN